jgi:ABC-type nitrate/sulfonate/bicarbonate transport system substrate-binding protein
MKTAIRNSVFGVFLTMSLGSVAFAQAPAAPDVVHFVSSGAFPSPLANHDITSAIGAFADVEKKFNTKIDVNDMANGPTAMAALLGGSVDFLVTSGNAFSRAAVQGQPVVAVMMLSQGFTGTMIAPKKLASRGSGLANLKKWNAGTWGVASVGGIAEFGAKRAAEDAGLKWADQNVVYTGSSQASAAGVAAERLDIGGPDDWTSATVVANDQAFVVINLSDLKGDVDWDKMIGWVLAARKDTVEKYPELTKAMVEAELKGLLKSKELKHNAPAALKLYTDEGKDVSAKAFAIYWALNVPSYESVTGFITPTAIQASTGILRALNAIQPDQQLPTDAFDNSFVQAAYKDMNLPLPK